VNGHRRREQLEDHVRTGLVTAITVCSMLVVSSSAGADVSVNVNIGPPPPIVVSAPPPLVVVPAVPAVQYAPSLTVDLFHYGGHYYYWQGGHWFVGPSYRGPWTYVVVERLPRPILAVPVQYYKIPPGHAKKLQGGRPPGHARGGG
jgi:hypothetical protein